MRRRKPARAKPVEASRRALTWWFGLMALGGFVAGLNAERRPFGEGVFAYPLVVFFIAAGAALLLLRVLTQRPVPEILPDRALLIGCAVGVGLFLAGNFIDVRLLSRM